MDADATSGHFDYSSISSILQRKQVLLQKLTVVEKKQKEEENLNAQYLKQKQKLELRNLVEERQMDLVGQKEQNLDTVAKELAEMNIIEN
jgi:DNA-binding transcriptional regulator YbjK